MEVVDNSSTKRGEIRVVIEVNFRAEFEMARGGQDYNRLISCLPEVFVGKAERLGGLIKIVCSAAKTCMKEKKMHLGPWRKHKYMQAKWFGTVVQRSTPGSLPPTQASQPRASILTFDLTTSEAILPALRSKAVQVL